MVSQSLIYLKCLSGLTGFTNLIGLTVLNGLTKYHKSHLSQRSHRLHRTHRSHKVPRVLTPFTGEDSTRPAAGRTKYSPPKAFNGENLHRPAAQINTPEASGIELFIQNHMKLKKNSAVNTRPAPPRKMVSPAPRHDTGEDM